MFYRILALCFLALASAYSQSLNTGTFFGTVRDASGATVPDAAVRITREGTLFQRDAATDAEGNYRLLEIPAGEYRLDFEKAGFRKVARTGILISAGQSLRVDVEMPVGSVSETVQVEAKVAQVDTSSATPPRFLDRRS